jgi:hypothetical protein
MSSIKKQMAVAGFANGRAATGVHDDLWARCLAMSAGRKPVVICGVDSIGLFFEDVQEIRDALARRSGARWTSSSPRSTCTKRPTRWACGVPRRA